MTETKDNQTNETDRLGGADHVLATSPAVVPSGLSKFTFHYKFVWNDGREYSDQDTWHGSSMAQVCKEFREREEGDAENLDYLSIWDDEGNGY